MAEGGGEDHDVFLPGDDMSEDNPPRHYLALREELMESKVRDFYKSLEQEPPEVWDSNDFEMDSKNHLFVKDEKGNKIKLTTEKNPHKFLKKSTIRQRLSVSDQNKFNIPKKSLHKEAVAKLQNTLLELPTETELETAPLKDLSAAANEITAEMETSLIDLSNKEEETQFKKLPNPLLPMREIMALNESLQSIRGELINNLAKLSELDEHINREKQKLVEADDGNLGQDIKDIIQQRLNDLQIERAARLEVLSDGREKLRSQVNRIRETIQRVLYENTTLAERIRTLFKEQGVTIASVITALGFAISTLVLALTGTGGGGGGGHLPPDKNWVRKQLDHIKQLLKKLGEKALVALPGILGSIVSWIFSTASKVVGVMAEHLWALMVFVVALILRKMKTK